MPCIRPCYRNAGASRNGCYIRHSHLSKRYETIGITSVYEYSLSCSVNDCLLEREKFDKFWWLDEIKSDLECCDLQSSDEGSGMLFSEIDQENKSAPRIRKLSFHDTLTSLSIVNSLDNQYSRHLLSTSFFHCFPERDSQSIASPRPFCRRRTLLPRFSTRLHPNA